MRSIGPESDSKDVHAHLIAGVPAPLWLRAGFWACTAIAVAVVIRRIAALASPSSSGPPQLAGLDRTFAAHSALTLAHILPAMAFVVVAPFVLFPRFSHWTWPERWLFPLGVMVGITAYAMSLYSIGGWIERSAVLFFNTLFLFSLVRAWQYKVRGQTSLKNRWLLRAVVVLLGIATTRPVMGVFFCHKHDDASRSPPVLWDRILDWLFHQLDCDRELASFPGSAGGILNPNEACPPRTW